MRAMMEWCSEALGTLHDPKGCNWTLALDDSLPHLPSEVRDAALHSTASTRIEDAMRKMLLDRAPEIARQAVLQLTHEIEQGTICAAEAYDAACAIVTFTPILLGVQIDDLKA